MFLKIRSFFKLLIALEKAKAFLNKYRAINTREKMYDLMSEAWETKNPQRLLQYMMNYEEWTKEKKRYEALPTEAEKEESLKRIMALQNKIFI